MVETLQLVVDPRTASTPLLLRTLISTRLGLDVNRIKGEIITRRSIDARQRDIKFNLSVKAYIDEPMPDSPLLLPIKYNNVGDREAVVIVGTGPAGLFAALRLIERGYRPIILERGKDVDRRRVDMAEISRSGVVNPNSNYCFGEGGAGAFSDGKLYTRSKKRGNVEKILQIFCQHGACTDILVDAHPHIGTDRLPGVIKAMRDTIINCGGEVRFDCLVTGLLINNGVIKGVETTDGNIESNAVILATGHSARDVYELLDKLPVEIEPKGIAVGVRIEHPQTIVDEVQYHKKGGRGKFLPPAEYSMLTRVDDRAVYSFCMCPGGIVIPSASGPEQQAVNGMSPSNRGTKWANSGMVVEILPDDLPEYEKYGDLRIMRFQQDVERSFYEESGCSQNAPAQRMVDFVESRQSKDLPPTSYAGGIHSARLDKLLPKYISRRLQKGFLEFGKKSRGFLTNEAILLGCETRTSAPVRILRDGITLQSVSVRGLFPAGEGAGYAGGIVSAAIDGERVADAAADMLSHLE